MIQELFPNVILLHEELLKAFWQTWQMVLPAFFFTVLLALPLGLTLAVSSQHHLNYRPRLYRFLSTITNIVRATPTLIIITAITPFTRLIMGTKLGVKGAIVPLVVAATPFMARQIESVILGIDKGVVEAAKSMGSSSLGIVFRVLIPESLSKILLVFTISFVSLINFSAIAGAIGGGGLGDFALNYGFQQFKSDIMLVTVCILITIVMCIEFLGKRLSQHFDKTN